NHGAGAPLIKANDTVYSMAVAVSPRMQEKPWYTLGNAFLNAILENAVLEGENDFSALGDIPRDFPWVAGFPWPRTAALGAAGNLKLVAYARIAAASVVNHCREVYV